MKEQHKIEDLLSATDIETITDIVNEMKKGNQKIISIENADNGLICVMVGEVSGVTSGHGKLFYFRKTDGKWKQEKLGAWLS